MNAIYETIKTMPTLHKTITDVQAACKDEDTTVDKLAAIIENDPMLSANLLKLANSPLYGLSKQVKTLTQAVSLFGIETIGGIVFNYGVKQAVNSEPKAYDISNERLSEIGIMQNRLATTWAKKVDPSLVKELSVVTILSDLGKLAISKYLSDKDYTPLKTAQTFAQIRKAEKELTGATTEQISALMFEKWNFNESTVEILKFVASTQKDVAANLKKIGLMLMIVKTCVNVKEQYTPSSIQKAVELSQKYNLQHFEDTVKTINR